MSGNVVARAKQLVASKKIDEARKLLLDEGFVQRSDRAVQAAYLELIPPADAKPELNEPLRRLASSDPDVRYKAIQAISREMFQESSIPRQAWASDPRVTTVLIDALEDEDKRVVEEAAGVLAVIVGRYFADLRAFEPLVPLLESGRKQTRVNAVAAIGKLSHQDRWRVLLPMFKDKAAEVRRSAVRQVVFNGADGSIPGDVLPDVKSELRRLLTDKDASTKTMAKTAIGKLEAK
jgi:HEAT repeat protein